MAQIKPPFETFARIKVVGVGGSGGNAIQRMMTEKIHGVEFIAINTDAQDLHKSNAPIKIHIGKNLTKGLGAGMDPEVGRQAAEENRDEIHEAIKGADMVFLTCGLGGGTGSGASSIIAEVARDAGALTIGVGTKPFTFEGIQRQRIAEEAWTQLKDRVDALITIQNDRLLNVITKDTSLLNAFNICDDVLKQAVQGISDLIITPGIINVDFADVKAIMKDAGSALVGLGLASGQERAMTAVDQAVNSPLLETSIEGAKGLLFAVSGGKDLRLNEIHDIAKVVGESVDPAAKIIFGAYHDRKLRKGAIKIILIATGFNGSSLKNGESSISTLFSAPTIVKPAMIEERSEKLANGNGNGEKAEKNGKEKKKTDEDVWDIPTFLRKKR
jgi:cell division protein FtsZ